jgi:hypothetical protein
MVDTQSFDGIYSVPLQNFVQKNSKILNAKTKILPFTASSLQMKEFGSKGWII